MIATDLSKQLALDADPKAILEIDFTGNLSRKNNLCWIINNNTTIFLVFEEAKETILNFSQGTVKVFWIHFTLIKYQYKKTQYNTLNVQLSHSQLNKLNLAIKNGTEVTLKVLSNNHGNSNDGNNFLHKLLLTNTQVLRFRKAFANGSSTNIKLSKTQLHKIGK